VRQPQADLLAGPMQGRGVQDSLGLSGGDEVHQEAPMRSDLSYRSGMYYGKQWFFLNLKKSKKQ
jgi:hypothetical protein